MNRALRTAAIALGVAACVGCVTWGLLGSNLTRCHEVDVDGLTQVDATQVRHLANVAIGQPLVLVDLNAAKAGVERHPWIASAEVRRAFPDRVVITVQERRPVALLMMGGLYLVDETGDVFRKADDTTLDLPVLTGIPSTYATEQPDLARRIVRDGLEILAEADGSAPNPSSAAADASGKIPRNAVSEVRFDARAGYVMVLRNGGELLLGFTPSDALARLGRLTRKGVDLSLPHRVDLASPRLAVVTPL